MIIKKLSFSTELKYITMPVGLSWPRYISVVTVAMLSMFAGSQSVHTLYRPLEDLQARVELEKENLRKAATDKNVDKVTTP
uniref:Uncharacterized protein n=1 Tax=Arion vulgaris TaxID=1028688 RepID=A0A0B7AY43_9EUPU